MTAEADPVPSLRDWAFAVYDRPEVQAACLELQDHHGMDVVALLWCIWAGEHHGVIEPAAMRRIVTATAGWQAEVVAPLRAVRRRLKQADADVSSATGAPGPAAAGRAAETQEQLRTQVAAVELAAEAIQLERLDAATQAASRATAVSGRPGAAAAEANLAALLVASGSVDDHIRDRAIAALASRLSGGGA